MSNNPTRPGYHHVHRVGHSTAARSSSHPRRARDRPPDRRRGNCLNPANLSQLPEGVFDLTRDSWRAWPVCDASGEEGGAWEWRQPRRRVRFAAGRDLERFY